VTDLNTIRLLLPEITLVATATCVFVASAFKPSHRLWGSICAIAFVLVAVALWRQDSAIWHDDGLLATAAGQTLSGPLFVDSFGHLGRWLAVALGLLFLPLAVYATRPALTGEFLGSAVLAFTGLMIVATAGDIILLLLGLELISIPTYVLLFLARSDRRGTEATMKYFFLSILSSALFLYGLSFLYGAAGSTNLTEIHRNLTASPDSIGLRFLPLAMILIFTGLGFKIAAVPFHYYAPDVYQATTNANAGLLAVLPKAAGVLAMARLAIAASPADGDITWKIALVMAIASMTLGNVCALWQRDLRRMMAYSSIAHAGYMLMGLAAGLAAGRSQAPYDGIGAMLFYLIVYCAASLGTFATLAYLSSDNQELTNLDQLGSLPNRQPLAAALLAVFMFSLSGIPPLAGFWGKLTLFTSAVQQAREGAIAPGWFLVLLIVAALNAAVAAGYYLRVVATLYFGTSEVREVTPVTGSLQRMPRITAVLCGLIVIAVGLFPGRLIEHSGHAGESVQARKPGAVSAPLVDGLQAVVARAE